MKASIYISAEHIHVIGHNGDSIRQFVNYPLPEGTMYNGTILDSGFVTECLSSIRKANPALFKNEAALVVEGSSILSRRLTTPKLGKTRTLQLVRDDFADSAGDPDDLVCGYRRLSSSENAILACAVNKVQVDSYLTTFKEAGIKLDAIHIGTEVLLSFVKSRSELKKSTIVLNVIDGFTMLSMLFENGDPIFTSRTRLYGEDREQVIQSMLDNLDGLIQFTHSQKFGEITSSYYLGINETDIRLLNAFNPHTNINLGTLMIGGGQGDLPPDAHFACLNMLYGGGCINIVAARYALDKYIKRKRPRKLWIPFFALYVAVLAAAAGYLWMEVGKVEKSIGDIDSYINAPSVIKKRADLDAMMRKTAMYSEIARQAEALKAWEESLPKASSSMLDRIILLHGVDVAVTGFEFDENTGIVRVSAVCADASVSSDYVDALYKSGVARTVSYQGYGSASDGSFVFTVDIVLSVEEVE